MIMKSKYKKCYICNLLSFTKIPKIRRPIPITHRISNCENLYLLLDYDFSTGKFTNTTIFSLKKLNLNSIFV